MGDGVAIDPTEAVLVAPVSGEVVQVHASQHACSIRTDEGIEILMHIGLDTVKLRGEGFKTELQVGQKVETGDTLIEFDMDLLAQKAKSLLTMVVISTGSLGGEIPAAMSTVWAKESELFECSASSEAQSFSGEEGEELKSPPLVVPNPTGIHARPAAVLANLAKRYQASVKVCKGEERANARSVVGVLGLEIGKGDQIHLVATGSDAQTALDELSNQIRQGLGEGCAAPAPASLSVVEAPAPAEPEEPDVFRGVTASGGLAVGQGLSAQAPGNSGGGSHRPDPHRGAGAAF